MLLHPVALCSWCARPVAPKRTEGTMARILDVGGIIKKMHIPRICQHSACPGRQRRQWHNFRSHEGKHVFVGPASKLRCFMLTTKFGVTMPFLHQLHYRMLREHVSFAGEADVAHAMASMCNSEAELPQQSLRLYLSRVWFFWRLCIRLEEISQRSSPCPESMQSQVLCVSHKL